MNKEIEHNKFWQDTYYYAGAYLAGGPAGIAGAFLGLAAYQYIKSKDKKHIDINELDASIAPHFCSIACAAKLLKLGGMIINTKTLVLVNNLIVNNNLNLDANEIGLRIFMDAAYDEADFDFYVEHYAKLVNYEYNRCAYLITMLISFANVDGDYSPPERDAIDRAINILRLPSDLHDQILYCEVIAQKINELPGPMFGSGFFINDKGFIITNDHVIGDRKNIKVRAYDKFKNADVIMRDKESDLCLLHIDVGSVSTPFCTKPILEGQAIFTYGYPEPRSMGYSPKLTKGVISSKFGAKDDAHRMQIDAAIQPGNSGGPVIDCDSGAIVGLVSSRLKKSQKANYAIKSDRVLSFLGKMEVLRKSVDISDNSPRDFTQIVEDVNKSTVQVISCK